MAAAAPPTAAEVAAALAAVHHLDEADDGPRLVDYAESPRVDDWTLRAALVRLAQPEPVRASAVLELIRRTDGALGPHRRRLETERVPTVPQLGPDATPAGLDRLSRVWDARATDLARVLVRIPDGEAVVQAYGGSEGLDDDEEALVPLLAAAVELDALADALVGWAHERSGPPPLEALDRTADRVFARLGRLGVPREGTDRRRGRRNT